MYDYLRGTLITVTMQKAILDVNGIGYQIYVPMTLQSKTHLIGTELLLYTSLVIREQSHSLFGFVEQVERELFEQLIALSGIGPKTALNLIGHLGCEGIRQAVALDQTNFLAKVPGIGKKTAERLIVELKGKHIASATHVSSTALSEALQALISLGYSPISAQKAIAQAEQEIGSNSDVSTILKAALRISKSLT